MLEKGASNGSGKRSKRFKTILIVVAVTAIIILAAVLFIPSGSGQKAYPISTGDWLEYSVQGKLANVSIGGEFIFHFTERNDRGIDYDIVTVTPSAPADQIAPFNEKPLVISEYFHYDGTNLYAVGEVLAYASSQYDGENITGLPTRSFGSFVDYQNVNRNGYQVTYTTGDSAHYINSHNGTSLEQWVANGTGLPIIVTYADGHGSNLTLKLWYTNIQWIEHLPRQ